MIAFDSNPRLTKHLYSVFEQYKIANFEKCSCFDYGPTPEELSGISVPLRDIPGSTLRRMEWFGDEWGTKNEVGYFLPRLMEYLAGDLDILEDPGFFSFFKYKLPDLFSDTNNGWTREEKGSLSGFFSALLKEYLSSETKVGMLIECVLTLDLAPQIIFSNWNTNEQTRKDQVQKSMNTLDLLKQLLRGFYLDNNERVEAFLDAINEG